MNLEDLRPSFVVHVVDSNIDRLDLIKKSFLERDFQVDTYADGAEVEVKLKDNPPHILFIELSTLLNTSEKLIEKCLKISPETRIILLSSKDLFTKAYSLFESGVFDYIFSDFFEQNEIERERRLAISNILKSADHAIEMDYYKFKNEQLEADASSKNKNRRQANSVFVIHSLWLKKLEACTSFTDSIDCFLEEISRYLSSTSAMYLKYVPAYRTLVTSRSVNLTSFTSGEKFELQSLFKDQDINDSNFEKSSKFKELMHDYTKWNDSSIVPLKVNGIVKGLFVINTGFVNEADSFVLACVNSLALKVSNIVLERRLHAVSHVDESTGIKNRKYLMKRLQEEVSRSRRIHMPVSFVLISFDHFNHYVEAASRTETNHALRLMGKLLANTSRLNDIAGRISSDEFALVLAHTPYSGALIKAERIRQLIEGTDFTQVAPNFGKVTVSVGVSEYPSHCKDVEDMLDAADKAMNEVSKFGGNQVCLSSPSKSFNPDFTYIK